MESIQLSVKGMKCGGCVSTVEKILNNSDGIENVSVNLLTESAYFEVTQKHIEIESVLENLKENGFPSKIYINDFSKKIILNNKNIKSFLSKKNKKKSKNTDLFIGFFGYELLNNLIDVKVPKQKNFNFPKGIFYKPEKKIKLSNKLNYDVKNFECGNFKININRKNYTKIFNKFKKKIKSGETYQIKICTKYKTKSKINPLDFFSRLSDTNLAPEAFMIKDNNYSIISCSPETLIIKKGSDISTKPIAGTVKKTKQLNKIKALNYFRKNLKETKEHNMIVDMERNDLSRICKVGSENYLNRKLLKSIKIFFTM